MLIYNSAEDAPDRLIWSEMSIAPTPFDLLQDLDPTRNPSFLIGGSFTDFTFIGNIWDVQVYNDGNLGVPQLGAIGDCGIAVNAPCNVAPGGFVRLKGSFLSLLRVGAWNLLAEDGLPLPTADTGVTVEINGRRAPISYLSPTEVWALVPEDEVRGEATVRLSTQIATTSEAKINLVDVAPSLFAVEREGKKYPVAVSSDGSFGGLVNTDAPIVSGKPGELVALYGTGFGPTKVVIPSNRMFLGDKELSDLSLVSVLLGDRSLAIDWAGRIAVGVDRIHVRLPDDLEPGKYALAVKVGESSSPSVTFSVSPRE